MAALERGHEPPEAVVIDVPPPALPYYRAWWRLHAARVQHVGMTGAVPSGLPWSEVTAIARHHGARSREDIDDWDQILNAMEAEYFKHVAKER